ncbi:MAG TPA: RagB/SusD family nutrient uptake outer membrane protein [Puia sp.]|nr:RagB/SusD family nutrient uptake outer membrane protein [Puia sp.]
MKKIFYIVWAGFSVTGLCGCKKFLDLQPISDVTSAAYYKTATQAETTLTGAYDALQPATYYGFHEFNLSDVQSDNSSAGGDSPDIFQVDNFTATPTNLVILQQWPQVYTAIGRDNDVIDHVTAMDASLFTGQRKEQIIGEAKFLRALNYFNLVREYGNIPLQLKSVSELDNSVINLPQSSPEDVYNAIIADLQYAADNLPADMANGRAGKGAALGMLAKVYLTLKNWQKAADYAQQVIDLNKYSTNIAYDDIFTQKHNTEVIFDIQFTGGPEGTSLPDLLLPYPLATYEFKKFGTPTPDMIAAYEPGDVRKASSIIFQTTIDGPNFPHVYKYRNAAAFAAATNFIVLRFADVKLMLAEALNEISYGDPKSFAALNDIRQRAGLSAYTNVTLPDQSAFREALYKERRVELAFEGHRWADLVRTGRALSTMQATYPNITAERLVLPIPQPEIDKDKALKQNPGY